jgi:hypothetical protein
MMDERVVPSTKDSYLATLSFLTKVCKEHFPRALADGKLIIPMSSVNLKALLGRLSKSDSAGKMRSKQTLQGYISALKWQYRVLAVPFPSDDSASLREFSSGVKKVVAKKKSDGIMDDVEGKDPVAVAVYEELLHYAYRSIKTRAQCFIPLYIVLSWNMFARSSTVAKVRMSHIRWEGDALIISIVYHKSDQTGERVIPLHLYANPYKPWACPILALGLYLFGVHFREGHEDLDLLFEGNVYETFTKFLKEALPTLQAISRDPKRYGTHSFRKGVSTYCAGFIGGPSVVSIFLRAGWSLGNVQDRYLHYCDGGDQFCGRMAALLNMSNGSEFAVLPPRFARPDVITREEWDSLSPYIAKNIGGSSADVAIRCAAQVVYQWDWVCANVSAYFPIFTSRLVTTGLLNKLRECVLAPTQDSECPVTHMVATGVPPHVEIARQLKRAQETIKSLEDTIKAQSEELKTQMPRLVAEYIRDHYNIQG